MKKFFASILLIIVLTSCGVDSTNRKQSMIDQAKSILTENNLDGDPKLTFSYDDQYSNKYFDLNINSIDFDSRTYHEKVSILKKLSEIESGDGYSSNQVIYRIDIIKIISNGNTYRYLYKNAQINNADLPVPTSAVPDFQIQWQNSEIYGSGEMIVIVKEGSTYTMTTRFSDGSTEAKYLSVETVDGVDRLYENPGNLYGDYMVVESDGDLAFYDDQGFIYRVPPYK